MNRLTKLPLALAVGGAMALGATSATQADVMASAVAQLSNFEIHHTGGAILDYNTDFALNNGVPISTISSILKYIRYYSI